MPLRPFQSIQWKMVVVFLLLILLAMELIGAYLLESLQNRLIEGALASQNDRADIIANIVADPLAQGDHLAAVDRVRQVADPSAEVLILDEQGTVVASSQDASQIGQRPYQQFELVTLALRGARDTRIYEDPTTQARKAYIARPILSSQGRPIGAVLVMAPLGSTYDTLAQVRTILFRATLLALAGAAFLSLIIARTITGPVREVTGSARRMAGGDFSQRIDVRAGDEVGELGAMFNTLAGRLKETLDEISTEKQKAETILTHMADGILALDRQGRTILINPAARAIFGLRDDESVLGEPAVRLHPEGGMDWALAQVLGGETPPVQRWQIEETGRIVTVQFASQGESDGQVRGMVCVLHDVTEQEQLEGMRKEFIANVSHELRTPLTAIKSYVETLLEGGAVESPDLARNFLGVVDKETNRMVRLVNDLLQLSQIDSQKVRWERRAVDLRLVVEDVYEKVAERCEKKQVELVRDWPEELAPAYADRDRMVQVVTNLVTNAIDFTPPGGRVTAAIDQVGDMLEVRIIDTGIGIPAEDLPRVFDRFYRVDKTRSREFGGTGLGLSIARQIVEVHGGHIGIQSQVGSGTTITFTVPLAPAGEVAGEAEAADGAETAGGDAGASTDDAAAAGDRAPAGEAEGAEEIAATEDRAPEKEGTDHVGGV